MKRPRLYYWAAALCAAAAVLTSVTPAHAASSIVYFNIRHPDGTWQGFQAPAQPPGGCCDDIAEATDVQNDSTHVDVMNAQGLWDNVRYSNGTWQGWERPAQPLDSEDYSQLAEAGDRDGNIWFVVSTPMGLYYTYRLAAGTWGSWVQMDSPPFADGTIMGLAVATDDVSYQVQVMAVTNTGVVDHNVYTMSTRTWQGWAHPAQVPGGAVSIAAAGEVSGNVQFIALNNSGVIYHNIRYHDGSWQGWAKPPQPPQTPYPSFDALGAAVDSDGNAQFTVPAGIALYHTVRYVNGTWQQPWAAPAGTPGSCITSLAVATQTYLSGAHDFYFATYC
jgi:hypothetical protein